MLKSSNSESNFFWDTLFRPNKSLCIIPRTTRSIKCMLTHYVCGESYSIIIIYYCRGYLLLFPSSSSSMPSEWCRLLTSIVSGQYPPISPICPRPTPAPPHCTFCYSDILMKIFVHLCRLLIVLVQGSPFHLSSIDDQRNLQNVGNAKNCNFKIPEILLALPRGTVVWRQNC